MSPRERQKPNSGLTARHHAFSGVLRVQNTPVAVVNLPLHTKAGPEPIPVLIRYVEAAVPTILIPAGLVLERNSRIVLRLLPAGRSRGARESLSSGFRLRERVVLRVWNLVVGALIGGFVSSVTAVSVAPSTANGDGEHASSDEGAANPLQDLSAIQFVGHGNARRSE